MPFNFLLTEDGGYLLQEDGTSKIIVSEYELPQKINLEVKRSYADEYNIEYMFRLTSHDTVDEVILSNYRIVQYLNTRNPKKHVYQLTQIGSVFGDVEDSVTFSAPVDIVFNTVNNPPNIFPETERFMLKRATRFNSGIIKTSGSGCEDIGIRTSMGILPFGLNSDGKRDYDPSHCRTSTDSLVYEDNVSFVLEYNNLNPGDPYSPNWEIVTEYVTYSDIDPNTGQYPFGPLYSDKTNIFNTLVYPSKYNSIKESSPTEVDYTSEVYGIYSGDLNKQRTLCYYDLSPLYSEFVTVQSSEINTFNTSSTSSTVLSINELTSTFDTLTANWNSEYNNEGDVISSVVLSGNNTDYTNSYIRFLVDSNSTTNGWISSATSASNYGVVIKHLDESMYLDNPLFATSNYTSGDYAKPFMVINTVASSAEAIWVGGIDSNWSNASNWIDNNLPSAYVGAVFDGNISTTECILDSNQTIFSLSTRNTAGVINLSNSDLTLVGGNVDFTNSPQMIQGNDGRLIVSGSSCDINMTSGSNVLSTLVSTYNSSVNIYSDVNPVITSAFSISGILNINKSLVLSGADVDFADSTLIDSPRDANLDNDFLIIEGSLLSDKGTINSGVKYQGIDNTVIKRSYNGKVILSNENSTSTLQLDFVSGDYYFNDGLVLENIPSTSSDLIIDASANSASVFINNRVGLETIGNATSANNDSSISLYLGSNEWTISTSAVNLYNLGYITYNGAIFYLTGDVSAIIPPPIPLRLPSFNIDTTSSVILNDDLRTDNFIISGDTIFNINNKDVNAENDIIIYGGENTVQNIEDSIVTGKNIKLFGSDSEYLNLQSDFYWYIGGSESLNGVFVKLKSSDASLGETGYAYNSLDLGDS